jgi:two-component system, OmpR family, sensor histidine kinase BaeS
MRSSTSSPHRPALGLAWRLFAAVGLVVIAGAGTMLVAVLLVAEPAFHSHLTQVQPPMSDQAHTHVDEAFASAVLISLAVGVVVALAAALVVTWLVARRLAAPVAEASEAAYRIADGDFETRLEQPGLGPELDRLTAAFNTMAGRLATTEQTRRRLLSDLAHELRTPLASMQATIEGVADGILPHDETTLATLTEQSQRLHRLVGDLSAVSRAEERQLMLHPVETLVQDVVFRTAIAARPRFEAKGITLTASGSDPTGQALVDPDRLAEALGALLDNALRHTAESGAVTIATSRHGDRSRIVVSDDGEGFDPDLTAHLFERFYRGDTSRTRNGAGSGIGLTIARAIIEAHHGQLRGHSDGPGRGAQFEITLPVSRHSGPATEAGMATRA